MSTASLHYSRRCHFRAIPRKGGATQVLAPVSARTEINKQQFCLSFAAHRQLQQMREDAYFCFFILSFFFLKINRGVPYLIFFLFYIKVKAYIQMYSYYKSTNAQHEKLKKHYRNVSDQLTRASAIFFLVLIQTRPISSLKSHFQ